MDTQIYVVSTQQVADTAAVYAPKAGIEARVVAYHGIVDGMVQLEVAFKGAPASTMVFLGEDCELTPESRRKLAALGR